MSSGSGDARKRPRIFDLLRAVLTPPVLPEDDGEPISPPPSVTTATVMSILAGLVFLLIGGVFLATVDEQMTTVVTAYNRAISTCTVKFGGIGDAVVVPSGATADDTTLAESCKRYQPLTDEAISTAKTRLIVVNVVSVAIGLIAVVGGWFLRAGTRHSRLTVGGAVVLSSIITVLFEVLNIFILAATMVLIIAVMLCYTGKGAIYFARLKARRTG